MKISYGYADATGEYYLTIDTDRCNGCGDCVPACPKNILEMCVDDYDETKVRVEEKAVKTLGFTCPGTKLGVSESSCRLACKTACPFDVFEHSW